MTLLCLGINHHSTPLALRERLALSPEAVAAALERFAAERASQPGGLTELAVLSTCNRLEVYAVTQAAEDGMEAPAAAWAALEALILSARGLSGAELEGKVYRHVNDAAAQHLCRVAAGLDSMVLGEPQILGQVRAAHRLALEWGSAGPLLSALFSSAIRAGKRARTETAIGQGPATISSTAIHMLEAAAGHVAERQIVVVGAGEMAGLAVAALRQRGARQVTVVNRTWARAIELAERWQAQALPFERLAQALAEADVVLAATAATAGRPPIGAEMVAAALAGRSERPLLFVDLGVPRNVDPAVRQLPRVRCFDLDDLQAHLDDAGAGRQAAVPQVEAIAAAETQAFLRWLGSQATARLIAELHARAEAVGQAEVARTLRHLPHLSEAERAHVEALGRSLVNKLLHTPTARLRDIAPDEQAGEYAAAVRDLFGLDGS